MISLRRITNITPASRNRKLYNVALDFNFRTITETDVSDVIENINPRKSSGWNSPTVPILLKKTASAIAPSSMTVLLRAGPLSGKWGMDTRIKKGRQTSQTKLSPDYSTPITWQSVLASTV